MLDFVRPAIVCKSMQGTQAKSLMYICSMLSGCPGFQAKDFSLLLGGECIDKAGDKSYHVTVDLEVE